MRPLSAQCNQMRRALEYKLSIGEEKEVRDIAIKAGGAAVGLAGLIVAGNVCTFCACVPACLPACLPA